MNDVKREMIERAERLNEMLKDEEFGIDVRDCFKNNGIITTYILKSESRTAAPTIRQEEVMKYSDDEELIRFLIKVYEEYKIDNLDIKKVMSRENILKNVKPKLISESNLEDVKKSRIVYTKYLDMLVLYYVSVEELSGYELSASYTLKEENINALNISVEELHKVAVKNIEENYFIRNMEEVISEIIGMPINEITEEAEPDVPMFVISSMNKINGASTILSKKILDKVAECLQGDYYIIPSSIHECIAVPADITEPDELRSMVQEVNDSQVEPEERLTYSIYGYVGGKLQII